MKIKTLICNSKGLDSFPYDDRDSRVLDIKPLAGVSHAASHRQFLATCGSRTLEEVLRMAEDDSDTFAFSCGGVEEIQDNLFKKAVPQPFPFSPASPQEMLSLTKDGILSRVRERLVALADSDAPKD